MNARRRSRNQERAGAVNVLAAMMIVVLLCCVAFSVDLGFLMVAGTELQRTADAAALAAAWDLIDDEAIAGSANLSDEIAQARMRAAEFAGRNYVTLASPGIGLNVSNSEEGDVLIGYLSNPSDSDCQMTFDDPNKYNAVRVRVHKSATQNGEVPLFFARVLGLKSEQMEADATAAILNNIGGFRAPPEGKRLDILPIALDLDTWNDMLAGGGSDDWHWDEATSDVVPGADGIREVNLYPEGTGSPGNRGTVDIGGRDNSTAVLARQVMEGISEADLTYHGGELSLDDKGELSLNGDTGISAGIKDELAKIIGQPKIIPIFSKVIGPGNNADYTIVRFVGVRIMEVKLTGSGTVGPVDGLLGVKLTGSESGKKVIIQPATIMAWGGTPSTGETGVTGETYTSDFIYSPAWIVR